MAKKSCPDCVQEVPKWMVTFSDMTTLLLVFFVMLMSTGETKIVKTMIILSAFDGKLGLMKGGQSLSPGDFENMGQNIEALPSMQRGKSLSQALERAQSLFKPESINKKVRVMEDERGIVISLLTDMLFEPNEAEVRVNDIMDILENVRLLLDSPDFSGKMRIEGHSDNQDYSGSEFKDNWDLSMNRAWSVLNALRKVPSLSYFDESKISISGYGSTRPIESNDTPEGRKYNRRVDLILLREGL